MVEQIMKDVYRIEVGLLDNPLKELNSYYIRGEDRDLLIDTGFRCEACYQDLINGLREIGADMARLDLFITHVHSDHSGLAGDIAGKDAKIFMSKADLKELQIFLEHSDKNKRDERYIKEGFPKNRLSYVHAHNPATMLTIQKLDDRFQVAEHGMIIQVGNYCLEVVEVPGHTPGNLMLWMKDEGVMFTGDHILFDITPNITMWPGVEDSLGDYLQSLKKCASYPVKLALPGHRKKGDFHKQIKFIEKHHEERLKEIESIIKDSAGLTAYEIASKMKWKIRAKNWEDFPPVQQWFAVGECMAHLDHLRKKKKIKRIDSDNLYRYI